MTANGDRNEEKRMSNIDYEVRDEVAHVRINRPEKHNGLTLDMIDDLAKAADRAKNSASLAFAAAATASAVMPNSL